MREQYLCDKNMYNYSAGGYCGVFMPQHVMKKIAKLAAQYSVDVRKVLNEHKDELLAAEWTLANQRDDNGKIKKQVTIHYARENAGGLYGDNVENRISLFKPAQPEHLSELYIVDSYEQAQAIAAEILAEELETEMAAECK
jgi:hypothetical protein